MNIDDIKKCIENIYTENIDFSKLTPPECISTGFTKLDNTLGNGGLRTGRLYALGALTGLGKTTFALNIADNISELGKDVLFFSLEMSRYELISKIHSRNMAKLEPGTKNYSMSAIEIMDFDMKIRKEPPKQESLTLLKNARDKYNEHAKHLSIFECSGNFGVKEIETTLKELRALERMPSVVIVDYLQILHKYEDGLTDKQCVDKNILELKRLTKELNVSIIVISSINRSSYDDVVDIKSFKESGSIEYSCDVLMSLSFDYKDNQYSPEGRTKAKRKSIKRKIDAKQHGSENKEIKLSVLKNRLYKSHEDVIFVYYSKYDYFIEKNQSMF
jgi:replicative DNA helicase